MIRKLLLLSLILISISNARDLSCRMRAMGDDFALLIPDYETDVFYNPIFLGKKQIGIYYNTMEETQIKINFLHRSFGLYGFYWPGYFYNYESDGIDWFTNSYCNDRFKGVFLLKIESIGFSITPDISLVRNKYWDSAERKELASTQKFMFKASAGFHLTDKFFIFIEPTFGFWEELTRTQNIDTQHKDIFIPSGRINILYRYIKENNHFLIGYLEIGGPTSNDDVNERSFSHFSNLNGITTSIEPFGNSLTTNLGICRGFPIGVNSMIALGCLENFSFDFVSHQQLIPNLFDSKLHTLNNRVSLLIALEYYINHVVIRSGAEISHFYRVSEEQYLSNGYIATSQVRNSGINYNFSFGFGWQLKEKLIVDLKHIGGYRNYILGLDNWSIYLKYLL